MINYLYNRWISNDIVESETGKLNFFKHYLNEAKFLDKDMQEKFPISLFENANDNLRIFGVGNS